MPVALTVVTPIAVCSESIGQHRRQWRQMPVRGAVREFRGLNCASRWQKEDAGCAMVRDPFSHGGHSVLPSKARS